MKFRELARVFQEIEEESSRNAKTETLAKLLANASGDELSAVVHLSLGRLRPLYDSLEFNLAEKMVMRAIAQAYRADLADVRAAFKKKGDLGVVAEELVQGRGGRVSVSEVYERLVAVAEDSGQGSQERKVTGLAKLLGELDGLSNRYVVRVVLSKLRLGFSDKTILDALSVMRRGSKEGRVELDAAYQVRPDVAAIAALVKKYGIGKLTDHVDVALGTPVLPALAQRLKAAKEMIAKMGRVVAEPKFDGTRVQIHFSKDQTTKHKLHKRAQANHKTQTSQTRDMGQNGLFGEERGFYLKSFTRNLDENSHMFPELSTIDEQIKGTDVVLDCEAVGYDPKTGKPVPFQMTITRKRKHGVADARSSVPLKFYVFDILYKDGKSLLKKPLLERRKVLDEVIVKRSDGALIVDEYIVTEDPDKLRAYHTKQLEKGLEGAMVKRAEGPYTPGRTGWNWVKFKEAEGSQAKLADTLDCVVMGYYRGRGKRTDFGIGAFLVGVADEVNSGQSAVDRRILTIAKIGTGLTDKQFLELRERLRSLQIPNPKYQILNKSKILNINNQTYVIPESLEPDVWVEPAIVVEIAADEITKSPTHSAGLALRFPRLVKFRDDKGPEQVTTLDEVKELV